ncbi:MAG: 5'-nucleotidase C-terminal domain-containing protein, partial [Gemmatimonadota bacterium]|nr:5'-nucleotidase C-terminal domain-containing protein [Gemmatimonadota bacterium]
MKRLAAPLLALTVAACSPDLSGPDARAGDIARVAVGSGNADVHYWLTLLHNNDGESQIIDLGTGLEDFGGIARFATLVDELKRDAKEGPRAGAAGPRVSASMAPAGATGRPPELANDPGGGAILVTSGDNFLAGPEFNLSIQKGIPYFDAIAYDLIGYDALALGNHEFDFGPGVLENFIRSFSMTMPPFLSANLDFSGEPGLQSLVGAGKIAESTVVKKRGAEIGIIGATTPNLSFISSPRNVIVLQNVAAEVQAEVDRLEAEGVNKIILISHLQGLAEDLALLSRIDGVDVVVAGGGDELLANPGDVLIPGDEGMVMGPYPTIATDMDGTSVPVVTTAGQYRYVGRLMAGFDKDGNVVAIESASGPVRVAGGANFDAVMPDPEVQARVVDPVAAGLAALASNVIGTTQVPLDGRRSEVRSRETNEGNLIADALLWQADQLAASFGVAAPDVALQNGGGIRNDAIIPAGDITELETFNILPFPNFVTVLENISRSQFKDILENAVSRAAPGDPGSGTGRFAQVAGFSFDWDPTGQAIALDPNGNVLVPGTRVQNVTLDDGTQLVVNGMVQAGADVTVATIDFLAKGGDQYPFRGAPFTTLG